MAIPSENVDLIHLVDQSLFLPLITYNDVPKKFEDFAEDCNKSCGPLSLSDQDKNLIVSEIQKNVCLDNGECLVSDLYSKNKNIANAIEEIYQISLLKNSDILNEPTPFYGNYYTLSRNVEPYDIRGRVIVDSHFNAQNIWKLLETIEPPIIQESIKPLKIKIPPHILLRDITNSILLLQGDIPFPKNAREKSEINALEKLLRKCEIECYDPSAVDTDMCDARNKCRIDKNELSNDEKRDLADTYREIISDLQKYSGENWILKCNSKTKQCKKYGGYKDVNIIREEEIEEEKQLTEEEERIEELFREPFTEGPFIQEPIKLNYRQLHHQTRGTWVQSPVIDIAAIKPDDIKDLDPYKIAVMLIQKSVDFKLPIVLKTNPNTNLQEFSISDTFLALKDKCDRVCQNLGAYVYNLRNQDIENSMDEDILDRYCIIPKNDPSKYACEFEASYEDITNYEKQYLDTVKTARIEFINQ